MGHLNSTSSDMVAQIFNNEGYYLVYEDNHLIKGWLGSAAYYNVYSGEIEGTIFELYVLPEYRQRGIAGALLEYEIRNLTEKGITNVHLNVYAGNPAKRLYEKVGFTDVSVAMVKRLG